MDKPLKCDKHVALRHHFRLDIGRERSVVRDMGSASKKSIQSVPPGEIPAEVERLCSLSLRDLRVAWATEFRRDPPKGLWRDLLLRMLAWRLQEEALGGHDKATIKLLEVAGQKRAGDQRCQRLKAGTVLIREFEGTRHTVTIVPEGFFWRENTYSSLSVIARIITGTNWNGPRFFGLREGKGGRGSNKRDEAA